MNIFAKIIAGIKSLFSNKEAVLNTAKEVVNIGKEITGSSILQAFVKASDNKLDDIALAALIKALNWADLRLEDIKNNDARAIILNGIAAAAAKYQYQGVTLEQGLTCMPTVYDPKVLQK